MPLSWNEIRSRAISFSKEWKDECSESAEAKTFWDGFFNVFGINRRRVASFEAPVKISNDKGGFVDLLWRGVLLVEHKSRGKDLNRAAKQAFNYFPGIKDRDLPQFVVISDFSRFRLYDLDEDLVHEFDLKNFHENVHLFGFVAGYQTRTFGQEDPVNIRAAEQLGKLHDLLKDEGYDNHPLEVLLVRILFCMFAEDTAIFERSELQEYLENRTAIDGSDVGMHLTSIFQTLNTPQNRRQKMLDEQLANLPYVNGKLFSEVLPVAAFSYSMRDTLLECCRLDWSRISPAIFGSLFQSIMNKNTRRNLGAHYTSETNILKVLTPLFLDRLYEEFNLCKRNLKKLKEFHKKLSSINIFDPACGCGNFLVIAYRELRILELDVLRIIYKKSGTGFLDISDITLVDVDQFFGIEIEEFPAQIAQVALWLTDHQMNLKLSEEFGQYFTRLPLKKSPTIIHGNALDVIWADHVPPTAISYIVGNPPFVGSKYMSEVQRKERDTVFARTKNSGLLDYVSCWHRKATEFMAANPSICTAFVSTNSLTQGEQAGILWPDLFSLGARINFAHRTFQWSSEARGKAAVHCVIIGFSLFDDYKKWIFEYESVTGEPHAILARNISPYLVDGPNLVITNRSRPICNVPRIGIGNKPIDGGHFLFTTEEKIEFVAIEPAADKWFRPWLGSREFLNGLERWCLWLGDCPPEQLRKMPEVMKRVQAVHDLRLASKSPGTNKLAEQPTRFHVENMPVSRFLIIPEVSSERRTYIPIGFIEPATLCSNLVKISSEATLYHFGVLSSLMHNSWMRTVAGRLKSDYRYSVKLVYNNFPWPKPSQKLHKAIESAAQQVLDARGNYPNSTLADLYDPLTTPALLLDAHHALDRAVDAAYGRRKFKSEGERVSMLFELFDSMTQNQS